MLTRPCCFPLGGLVRDALPYGDRLQALWFLGPDTWYLIVNYASFQWVWVPVIISANYNPLLVL